MIKENYHPINKEDCKSLLMQKNECMWYDISKKSEPKIDAFIIGQVDTL